MIANIPKRLLRAIGAALLVMCVASCAMTKATVKPDNCPELDEALVQAKQNHAEALAPFNECVEVQCRRHQIDMSTCWFNVCHKEYTTQENTRFAEDEAYRVTVPCQDNSGGDSAN